MPYEDGSWMEVAQNGVSRQAFHVQPSDITSVNN